MLLTQTVRRVTPPSLRRRIKRTFHPFFKRTIEWEYMPDGWQAQQQDTDIKGWNVSDIVETYKIKWPMYMKYLEGTAPLGIAHESDLTTNTDVSFHNTIMSYAYALTLASRCKPAISMLDWGGGIGHYYPLSKALIPDLEINYSCKDMPVFAEYGRQLFPEATFYTDETCLDRSYDFILASGSFQYSQDWQLALRKLARATTGWLFITRLPVVQTVPSYVFVQRPYFYGYNTEYLGWCLNQKMLLQSAADAGLELVREFITGERPYIDRAPEQNQYKGFLFRPVRTTHE